MSSSSSGSEPASRPSINRISSMLRGRTSASHRERSVPALSTAGLRPHAKPAERSYGCGGRYADGYVDDSFA